MSTALSQPAKWEKVFWPVVTALVFLTVWHFAVRWTGSKIFPSPLDVEKGMAELAEKGLLLKYIGGYANARTISSRHPEGQVRALEIELVLRLRSSLGALVLEIRVYHAREIYGNGYCRRRGGGWRWSGSCRVRRLLGGERERCQQRREQPKGLYPVHRATPI